MRCSLSHSRTLLTYGRESVSQTFTAVTHRSSTYHMTAVALSDLIPHPSRMNASYIHHSFIHSNKNGEAVKGIDKLDGDMYVRFERVCAPFPAGMSESQGKDKVCM